METLTTIATNFTLIWNSPKDWSLGGGPLWLVAIASIVSVSLIYFTNESDKRIETKRKTRRA